MRFLAGLEHLQKWGKRTGKESLFHGFVELYQHYGNRTVPFYPIYPKRDVSIYSEPGFLL
jgi:hypothetical protein